MTKVHIVKKARKDYPEHGIKKGDKYYWWQFAFCEKSFSKTPPTRGALTRSSYLQALCVIEDSIGQLKESSAESIIADLESIIDSLQTLKDEQEERLDNMPEQFKETSAAGETLQGRIDELDQWISDLESIDADFDPKGEESEEDFVNRITGEIQNVGI